MCECYNKSINIAVVIIIILLHLFYRKTVNLQY